MQNLPRAASKQDWEFIESCFKANSRYLGNWFFVKDSLGKKNHIWIVIPEKGFAHAAYNRKLEKLELKEIAVMQPGDGTALQLLTTLPQNIVAKTDADNLRSQKFYKKNNFVFMGLTKTRKGKEICVFERF